MLGEEGTDGKLTDEQKKYLDNNFDDVNQCIKGSLIVDLSKIYSENGDAISRQYCGSKAMHGAYMKMESDGSLKIDKRNENSKIFTKRLFNNLLGKDMKKQSALSLVTGHFKHKNVGTHPWKIDFIQKDVNFDIDMHKFNDFNYSHLFKIHADKVRELELDGMFHGL